VFSDAKKLNRASLKYLKAFIDLDAISFISV